ncbi:MAG: glutamine-hydrolyzing GMP synthase [Candidatus Neoclostridium sp.]
MKNQLVLVVDFGGQYNQLIVRRVRNLGVYAEMVPADVTVEKIREKNPIGIIFTGGPASVFGEDSPKVTKEIYSLGVPVLGICYGMQLIAHQLGGEVVHADAKLREYGKITVNYKESTIFKGVPTPNQCWMSHTDQVKRVPEGFSVIACTDSCGVAAYECPERKIYGVQFHPEVAHTIGGNDILKNFLYDVCGATGDWHMSDFAQEQIAAIRKKVGDGKVLCAMSGGVDSAVAATLIHKAVGDKLVCIFVDHGLLRKNEAAEVMRVFKEERGMNLIKVDASDLFLKQLQGVREPEKKRKIIGKAFIDVFSEEAKKLGKVDFLVQGTIYPDVIESGLGKSAVIKSHHNVGGLPSVVDFKEIIEPLRLLFKDEVRMLGLELGLPENIVFRQPFPGPGLAVRIIGNITRAKIRILQDADYIFREEIANAGLDREIWQYFAVLTGMRSVGVMGDERTYDYTIALRAVTSVDGMTADWADIPHDVLVKISSRIVNEVKHVNRVVYDITSKPPATIEWE